MLWSLLACTGSSPDEASPLEATPPTAAGAQPDIVLVVIDTLRADHLGSYGHDRPTSPSIDAMAAEGLRFDRAYAHSGWTLASFASLFTGLLPHQHRVGRAPADPSKYGRLSQETVTLAEALSTVGYATAAIMNNTFLAPEFGLNQGFGEEYRWQGASNDRHRSAADSVTMGLEWLNAQEQPAFLVVHMMEPHLDYAPAADLRGTFTPPQLPFPVPLSDGALKQGLASGQIVLPRDIPLITGLYDEEILTADRSVGVLRDGLAARGKPTVTVLTADHGEEFWDHGGFEHGHSLYGELTRVPLIITGPDIPIGAVRTVVGHRDLFRSLIAAGGATLPAGVGGDDLLGIASQGAWAGERTVLSENVLYGPAQVSTVDDGHRLVFNQLSGAGEVWQVAEDASERGRLQGQPQSEVAQKMVPIMEGIRGGDLTPIQVNDTRIPDPETFQMLATLGYIEEPVEPVEPEAPKPEDPPKP
ncbi:MAG: arylsulfatase A-like enzyme [Myxococcota bacterium]|jgi:arylsulfatase A-like enzyme